MILILMVEGGEGGKDGSSDPDGVLPLWWSNDLNLDGGWEVLCLDRRIHPCLPDILVLALDFLRGGVVLLLSLLTTSSQAEDQMEGGLLLDVVIAQGSAIFKLFAGENQSLLIGRNSLLILNLGFHIFNCVRGLNLKSDGLPCKGLHENLHGGF